ncbi:MAG: 50S ribosomal protein L11 methyltransferase [Rhodovibrionaceae bacterium]
MAEDREGPVPPRAAEMPEDSAQRLLKLCREGRLGEVERELSGLPETARDWRIALARGWAAARHGRNREAETALQRAAERAGRETEPALLLARLYRSERRFSESAAVYRQAIELDAKHAEARAELAQCLHALGALSDARETLEPLREEAARRHWPAERLHWLAAAYTRIARERDAIPLLEQAAEKAPTQFGIGHALRHLRGQVAPAWHFAMMRDEKRHAAYAEALAKTVTPESLVLEIGTGSGILAMLAAKAGARHVYSCESDPLIAETARGIVAKNGLAGKITVIAKPSQQLRIGQDLPEPADILLSEILGDTVFSEDLLAITADARARLLTPGAVLIPWKVAAMTCLAGGDKLAALSRVGRVAGFDLSAFNRFAPSMLALDLTQHDFTSLSAPREIFAAELAAPPDQPRQERFTYWASGEGRAEGLLQWNRLYLAEDLVFENAPPEDWRPSSWRHCFFSFERAIALRAGDSVEVTGLHNGKILSFLEGRWR